VNSFQRGKNSFEMQIPLLGNLTNHAKRGRTGEFERDNADVDRNIRPVNWRNSYRRISHFDEAESHASTALEIRLSPYRSVSTSSRLILPRATELGSKMVASCSRNVRRHAGKPSRLTSKST